MEHLERTLVEILKRLNSLERKSRTADKAKKNIVNYSSGKTTVYANDHRFLENINSTQYTHLTREEYNRLNNVSDNHSALKGLANDDHKQYIRHNLAVQDWDILAGSSGKVFLRKSIDQLRNKIAEKIFPESDSPNSITFYKSNGNTPVAIVDTSNSRVGINIQPETPLHLKGDFTINQGDINLTGNQPKTINSEQSLSLKASKDLLLNPDGKVVVTQANLQTQTFAEDIYGWQLKSNGDAEFQNIRVNKINARIVTTGIEQFVGGRQTMCKSASPLALDFVVPAPDKRSPLYIECFADYPEAKVFDDDDIVRLASVSLFNGEYNTSDCWGTVREVTDGRDVFYLFTRSSAPNSGSANSGAVIKAGELVLNYGTTGMGYIISTVV